MTIDNDSLHLLEHHRYSAMRPLPIRVIMGSLWDSPLCCWCCSCSISIGRILFWDWPCNGYAAEPQWRTHVQTTRTRKRLSFCQRNSAMMTRRRRLPLMDHLRRIHSKWSDLEGIWNGLRFSLFVLIFFVHVILTFNLIGYHIAVNCPLFRVRSCCDVCRLIFQ